jgi:tetratricopeptide (TPR) repeat protein
MVRQPPGMSFLLWFVLTVVATSARGSDDLLLSIEHLSSEEQLLLADASDGRWDRFRLLDAALIAEGCTDSQTLQACRYKLQAVIDKLSGTRPPAALIDGQLPEALRYTFDTLHTELLRGRYRANATAVSTALIDGDYNCVSATVLFHCLCEAQGIPVTALVSNTHVYCRVRMGQGAWDVQTTCAEWFRLSPAEQQAAIPATVAGAREVNPVQLIAKIYYNRGVAYLESADYAHADRAFRLAVTLDRQDTAATENLLATWNNWALQLCQQGKYAQAAALLEQGRRYREDYPPLLANQLHVTQRWAQALCREGKYGEAIALLHANRHLQPDAPLFVEGPRIIYRLWADALARSEGTQTGSSQSYVQSVAVAQPATKPPQVTQSARVHLKLVDEQNLPKQQTSRPMAPARNRSGPNLPSPSGNIENVKP